jgi:putative inorganic carbon (HCO3(-)) transporter
MRAGESSRILGAWRHLLGTWLTTELSSFGIFGVLCGLLSASVCFIAPPRHFFSSLLLSLILSVLSIPLLQSHRSLERAMQGSILIGGLLFGFCGLSDLRLGAMGKSRAHPWWALLLALMLSLIGFLIPSVYLFFALAVLPILLVFYAVPEVAATALLLAFPFLHLTPHPTVILTVAVLFLDLAWLTKALCGRRRMRWGILDRLVALLMLNFLLGGLIGAGREAGLRSGITLAVLISFWFPAVNLFAAPRWRARAVGAIRIASLLCAAYGIQQYFFGTSALRWVDETRFSDIGSRVVGCFENPNILAVYLILTAPFLLVRAMKKTLNWYIKLTNFLAFSMVFLCLILTWSRGAWLGILGALLLCALTLSRRAAALSVLALPSLACAIPYLPSTVLRRFASIGSFADSSIRYRFYTWRGVWRMIGEHPWGIGVGEAAFRAVYPRYALCGIESVMHTHQMPLQLLSELGIGGLLTFVGFMAGLFFYSIHALCKADDRSRPDTVAAASALLGATVMGMFDILWYQYGMCLLFFAVGAILTAPFSGSEEDIW